MKETTIVVLICAIIISLQITLTPKEEKQDSRYSMYYSCRVHNFSKTTNNREEMEKTLRYLDDTDCMIISVTKR